MIDIPPDTGDWVGAGFDTVTAITLIVPPVAAGVHAVGQMAKASIKVSAKTISRSASKRALAKLDTAILLATRQAAKGLSRSGGSEIIDISLRNSAAIGQSGVGRQSLEALARLGRKLGLDSNGFVVLFPDNQLAGHAANVAIFQTAENFAFSQAFKTTAAANLTDAAKRSLAELSGLWWRHDEGMNNSGKARK
jgi:predicted RNA-binding protein with TRAM domain